MKRILFLASLLITAAQAWSATVDVKSLVAVGKDGLGAVVARDNDKPMIRIEDVINRFSRDFGIHFGVRQPQVGMRRDAACRSLLQKALGCGLSALDINGCRPGLCCRDQQRSKEKYSFHFMVW